MKERKKKKEELENKGLVEILFKLRSFDEPFPASFFSVLRVIMVLFYLSCGRLVSIGILVVFSVFAFSRFCYSFKKRILTSFTFNFLIISFLFCCSRQLLLKKKKRVDQLLLILHERRGGVGGECFLSFSPFPPSVARFFLFMQCFCRVLFPFYSSFSFFYDQQAERLYSLWHNCVSRLAGLQFAFGIISGLLLIPCAALRFFGCREFLFYLFFFSSPLHSECCFLLLLLSEKRCRCSFVCLFYYYWWLCRSFVFFLLFFSSCICCCLRQKSLKTLQPCLLPFVDCDR
eukprot:TRINITY_DN13540_c7_g1_i1.p1 TRINITY_DN13540_c7_g1~~TRINITY_DN13540_c7_g1_i1.p1  ORF type:complete len:288 (+),score=-18.57 TRINITY_DN13540_c7_g1_i1:287-1150(+)